MKCDTILLARKRTLNHRDELWADRDTWMSCVVNSISSTTATETSHKFEQKTTTKTSEIYCLRQSQLAAHKIKMFFFFYRTTQFRDGVGHIIKKISHEISNRPLLNQVNNLPALCMSMCPRAACACAHSHCRTQYTLHTTKNINNRVHFTLSVHLFIFFLFQWNKIRITWRTWFRWCLFFFLSVSTTNTHTHAQLTVMASTVIVKNLYWKI